MTEDFFIIEKIYFLESMVEKSELIESCHKLLLAYNEWTLWYMKMPEDENPWFTDEQQEVRLCYFSLPMALNYQRNSYTLRENVLKSYNDEETRDLFSVQASSRMSEEFLREMLLKHKIALQQNKHVKTRQTIATTISAHWWTVWGLLEACAYDFLELRSCLQKTHKAWFPYLSWPKICNYRSFILQQYWWVVLKNTEYIDIAPDTHITQCSVRLWIISPDEALSLSRDALSLRWRELLTGSWITPIEMHSPLWFWSRNWFQYVLE